jgi:Flp pilus assembly protein TadG
MTSRPWVRRLRESRRVGGDDGAVIIEFALAAPLLIILVLGIFESAFALYDANSLTNSLRLAGRTLATLGATQNPQSDYLALSQMKAELSRLPNAIPVKVVVYETNATGTANLTSGSNCKNINPGTSTAVFGVTNVCNVYGRNHLASLNVANFGTSPSPPATPTSCTSSSWHRNYCPVDGDRSSNISSASGSDYIGVYAELEYSYITKLFGGGTRTITDYVVYKIEPPTP